MKVKVLASGSKGNTTLVDCGNTKLLIDVGISFLKIKNLLEKENVQIDDIDGILISHNHSDHINGLSSFIKKTKIMIYVTESMFISLGDIVPRDRCIIIDDSFNINDINIELVHTSHDAPASFGFIIEHNNKTLVHITDTGYINRKILNKILNKNIYVIESNHDEAMLMDGPYPRFLKERVISDIGHLSNKTTAGYLRKIIDENTKYVILAHLSETNNTKELAIEENKKLIENNDIKLLVADQNEGSELVEV